MKKKHLKIINKTIQSIDWDEVARMYRLTRWTWVTNPGNLDNFEIPDALKLSMCARDLAERAITEKLRLLSTGGITILWEKKRDFMQIFVGYSGDSE